MLVRDNPAESRYELVDDTQVAGFVDYRLRDGLYWLIHTEIEQRYQGAGHAGELVKKALDDLRTKGVKVVPTCPLVGGWIRHHPEYLDLVDQETLRAYKRSRQDGRRRTFAPTKKD